MGTHCLILLRWSKALFKNRQKVWAFICVYQDVIYNDPEFSLPKDAPYSYTEQFHLPSEGWSLNHLTLRVSGAYIYESSRTIVKKEVALKQVEKHLHGWAVHQGLLPREQVEMPVSQFFLEGVWLHPFPAASWECCFQSTCILYWYHSSTLGHWWVLTNA